MQSEKGIKIGDEILEILIFNIRRELKDSFELVQINTDKGEIDCQYYTAKGMDKAVVMVGGIGGGFDTPANNLYPRLCLDLKDIGISSLRVKFRYPADLTEAVVDVLTGIEFFKTENLRNFGLIGHSFGGAVVVQAAFNEKTVKTLVTLATQSYGIGPISLLPEYTSVLLIHGKSDKTLPAGSSIYAYNLAHELKEIKIYEGAGHGLNEVSDEVYAKVKDWIKENLK